MDYLDSLKKGILGGLAGGVVFGALMGMMGMLPMIGGMIGLPSALPGFLVHMMMSAAIGAGFGLFVGLFVNGRALIGAGVAYGALWWVLGPLTFMPWLMGMGLAANLNPAGMAAARGSLMGHLIYGAVLGFTVLRLRGAAADAREPAVGQTV